MKALQRFTISSNILIPFVLVLLSVAIGVQMYLHPVAVASAATSTSPSKLYKFSYINLDKSATLPGAKIQTINSQAAGIPVGVTLTVGNAEVRRLMKYAKGGSLATLQYDVYPAFVTKAGGALNVAPIFSNAYDEKMEMWANSKTSKTLTGTIPLDFARSLLPGQIYTLHIRAVAKDSSFTVDDYIHINILNTAMCQLKG